MSKLILFVCTGNTCRSPMAEYYFNSEMKRLNKENEYTALSRGLYAESGSHMSVNAQKILVSYNIIRNIGDILHKSTQIDDVIMKKADFIYGITETHVNFLKEHYPHYQEKIYIMPENIGDPYGGSLEIYEECFKKIKSAVDIIIKSLDV